MDKEQGCHFEWESQAIFYGWDKIGFCIWETEVGILKLKLSFKAILNLRYLYMAAVFLAKNRYC